MVTKKFIDKKKSATFHLIARDSSDPNYSSDDPSGDRVFVRIDNNPCAPKSCLDVDSAVFADASEEDRSEYFYGHENSKILLPDHVRREILELGFPDDGYNYLIHLREIKNGGAGSAFYQNPRANFDQLPKDIKAYDASMIEIPKSSHPSEEDSAFTASKTVSVRLQKAMDPEVAALLDDSGSDVEDLEEDFVIIASNADEDAGFSCSAESSKAEERVRRPLDEQFDLLELREYGSDDSECCDEYLDEFDIEESLAEKLEGAFKDRNSDLVRLDKEEEEGEGGNESPELNAEVIRKCMKYAEDYENESRDGDAVLFEEESSDGSEVWDCETIVSTYSTLENHPGKIVAPDLRSRNTKPKTIPGTSKITLKGRKEQLPMDFSPRGEKHGEEKSENDDDDGKPPPPMEQQDKKRRGRESKEEKKERKSAVKLERREARRMKKETKGLYKAESSHAQRVAASAGPSSIPLK